MKYLVNRQEGCYNKPCGGTTKEKYIRQDVRTTDDPKKVSAHNGTSEWWFNKGTNHRVVDGQMIRDFEEEGWFIEIKTIDEYFN